jgi:hypothetical protein
MNALERPVLGEDGSEPHSRLDQQGIARNGSPTLYGSLTVAIKHGTLEDKPSAGEDFDTKINNIAESCGV